ncbi:MAG: B12-binding domain-containing radical SAM protein [Acidobacteriota bacterium]
MQVFIVNPAVENFGFAFITPRCLAVLAAATPEKSYIDRLFVIDQTVQDFPIEEVQAGDLVGISIHTLNALHGYRLAEQVRKRGASVVFGGAHAGAYAEEALAHGDSVVEGDAEIIWSQLIEDHWQGNLQPRYKGGRVSADQLIAARWDLMKLDAYAMASVQTVRGCPKQCSFCSVWVMDGRTPRLRNNDLIIQELQYLYSQGFRLVMLADDNFYPYTLQDIREAKTPEQRQTLEEGLAERYDLMKRLSEEVPKGMTFYTQITMEVGDDPEYLAAMKKARIMGALIGIESVTEEGLKATNKYFNSTGQQLKEKINRIRTQGFPYILGSFILGIESDTEETFRSTAEFVKSSGITLAQFVPMLPLPGTVDFKLMLKDRKALKFNDLEYKYWLDPQHPRVVYRHPNLDADQIIAGVRHSWRTFYSLRAIWQRSRLMGFTRNLKHLLIYLVICKAYFNLYWRYGLATDSTSRKNDRKRASWMGTVVSRFFKAAPSQESAALAGMPDESLEPL